MEPRRTSVLELRRAKAAKTSVYSALMRLVRMA